MGRGVELVRVEREERTFDREEVLGRDTASVFPSLEGGGGAEGAGGARKGARAPKETPQEAQRRARLVRALLGLVLVVLQQE